MTPREIVRRVARSHGLAVSTLIGPWRRRSRRSVARARADAVWLIRQLTECSYPEIAKFVGMSNHTSALYADRRVRAIVEADPAHATRLLLVAQGRGGDVAAVVRADIALIRSKLREKHDQLRILERDGIKAA